MAEIKEAEYLICCKCDQPLALCTCPNRCPGCFNVPLETCTCSVKMRVFSTQQKEDRSDLYGTLIGRKIISYEFIRNPMSYDQPVVFAVCNDNTIWQRTLDHDSGGDEFYFWKQLETKPIPQPKA